MSFSNPTSLLWALLAIPIVIFYILKVRMRRMPVATVMFWEQVVDEKAPRSLWQQLRHLMSLLIQLLFLGLLIAAIADPFVTGQDQDRRRVVVVLDNSASMQVVEAGTPRLEEARSRVRTMIRSLKAGDEMAIVSAGTQPTVVCGLTSHQRTLQNALDGVSSTDGPTRVNDAVEIGRRLIVEHKKGEVVVVTDGCFPDAQAVASDKNVVWSGIGQSTDNVAITRFQVRRSVMDPTGFQILLEVTNFSDSDVECSVDLSFNDQLLDVFPLTLQPNEVLPRIFEKTSTDGGVLSVSLQHDEAFTADNSAVAILPPRVRLPVTLVTSGNWFLQRALEANDAVELTLADEIPDDSPAGSILVLDEKVPQKIPAGKVFVVQPGNATELWSQGGSVAEPLVASQAEDTDLLQHVKLNNVMMPEAMRLQPIGDHEVLVTSISDDPLYMRFPRPGGDVIVLTVNLDKGDLPLRTAFPILLTNALSWFADGKGELIEALSAGELATFSLPPEMQNLAAQHDQRLLLTSPSGKRKVVNVETDKISIGPLSEAGVWVLCRPLTDEEQAAADRGDVPTVDGDFLQLACNLNNPLESNLQVADPIEPHREVLAASFGGRPIWFYLTIAAFILTLTEWCLYQRRKIS